MTSMTPDEFREALKRHELTQVGFAQLVGAHPRSGQYWSTTAVHPAVATIMRMLDKRPELIHVLREVSGS